MLFLLYFKSFHFKDLDPLPSTDFTPIVSVSSQTSVLLCVHVREPVCLLVCYSVCVCVWAECHWGLWRHQKPFKGPECCCSKVSITSLSPLYPSHDVFHLPAFSYSLSLLGSSCPFPSVSHPSTALRPNNSRLCLPQAWTSSTSWLWQATVSKRLMLLLGMGRNWLHRAGLLLCHYKLMLRVALYTAVTPVWQHSLMFLLFLMLWPWYQYCPFIKKLNLVQEVSPAQVRIQVVYYISVVALISTTLDTGMCFSWEKDTNCSIFWELCFLSTSEMMFSLA